MTEKLKNFIKRVMFFRKLNKQLRKFGAKAWPLTNHQDGVVMQIQYGNDYTQMAVGPKHYKDKVFIDYLIQEIENKQMKSASEKNGVERY